MSGIDASKTESAELDGAETRSRDASMKVDASSLGEEESDFAKAMGFGSGSNADASDEKRSKPAPVTYDSNAASVEADDDEGKAVAADSTVQASTWEEIHPRPAADGDQATLQARADAVLARVEIKDLPTSVPPSRPKQRASAKDDGAMLALQAELETNRQQLASIHAQLADRDAELERVQQARKQNGRNPSSEEKELEDMRSEMENAILERDQLIDQLATTSGFLVQAQGKAEKLEASLRAARGALIPLPEGERALRAEVIGLRGRLQETAQENVRLASDLSSVATELAIATARVEDRQHEIDYHFERAAALETEVAEKDDQLAETILRHREVLALLTRLQSDNTELRGTQAALEETLQARDLEINAREEHLRVTRDGLALRDTQLVDINERLDQEQRRRDALEADLERGEIERSQLIAKIERRESRIATLTETLGRIEDVMGRRLSTPDNATTVIAEAAALRSRAAAPSMPAPRSQSSAERAPVVAPEPIQEPARRPDPKPEECAESNLPVRRPPPVVLDAEREDALDAIDPVDAIVESALSPARVEEITPVEDPPSDEDIAESSQSRDDLILAASPALPQILSSWRDRRFSELEEEAGATTVADFLADRLLAHLGPVSPEPVYLRSLGGSLPDAEVRLVNALHERGVSGIRVQVLDADERSADARRHRIELAALGETIDVTVGDLPDWNPDAPCHAILLSDALHAQTNTTQILDHLSPCVARGALLLFVGRIGCGPLKLSASTLMRLEELWQFLPESMMKSEGLSRAPFRGDDGGSPAPSVDAPAELLARFEATALAGFGHLADLLVGPSRGFALSDENDEALQLLESILAIDESRGMTEDLPPRHGMGVFAHGHTGGTEIIGQAWPQAGTASN